MRVTESMALRDFLNNLDGAREKMNEAQNKISTGRSILRPSDDPRDIFDILRLKADKVEPSNTNAIWNGDGRGWTSPTPLWPASRT